MIGILPTLADGHMTADSLSPNPRYKLLSEQILDARGEDISISIAGIGNVERLDTTSDSIVPEAACTSTQFHVQTSPDDFAEYWNASQAVSSVQLALGANAPYLLGRELWRETRIPLFEQATDTRSEELKAQGVRPRVWFGERWVNSVFDLFEENVRYFPALLPITDDEDPLAVLESGGTPTLGELRLHNGTIYRWNRPVYDIAGGVPHLRVENRVLAAGPTVADTVANAAFYFGLVRALAENERPLWSQMSFSAAEENFHVAAQQGIDAQIYWPGVGQVRVTELVLRRLLPLAHEGLAAWGVEQAAADRLLGIIEQRCLTGINGAEWFVKRMAQLGDLDRYDALRAHAPGLPRADAHQRAGPHLGLASCSPQPHPGPADPAARVPPAAAVDDDHGQVDPGLGVRRARRGQPLDVEVVQDQVARPGEPHPRRVRPAPPEHRRHDVGPQGVVGRLVDADLEPAHRPAGRAHVHHGREGPARERAGRARPRPGAAAAGARGRSARAPPPRQPARSPSGAVPALHRLPAAARDWVRCPRWEPSWWATCPSPRARPR